MISTPLSAALLRGALELEPTGDGLRPHRLPGWARAQGDAQLAMAEAQPSGVRVVVRTRATTVELETRPTKRVYPGTPPRPDGIYDLVVDGRLAARGSVPGGNVMTVDLGSGATSVEHGPSGRLRFDGLAGEDKQVEIWLPHDEQTELIALHTDAPAHAVPHDGRRTWLHHGSSISHGSVAASPTRTWPAVAAALGDVELVNLGFGGSALLDPFVARVVRDTPADVISLKLGINVVNQDVMRLRAFTAAVHGFLDTIRDGHPSIPLLLVSPILCPIHEEVPGPSAPDLAALAQGRLGFVAAGDAAEVAQGRLNLTVIREELARVVAQRSADDPHLHLLDGRMLYGERDAEELPLPDALHPDAATHQRMGERFARHAFAAGGVLAAA